MAQDGVHAFRFGRAFSRTFSTFFGRLVHFLAIVAVVWIPFLVAVLAIFGWTGLETQLGAQEGVDELGLTAGQGFGLLVIWILGFVAYLLFFGATIDGAVRHLRGLNVSFREAFATAFASLAPLLLVSLLLWTIMVGTFLVAALLTTIPFVGVVAFIAAIVGLAYLYLRWSVALPAVVVENAGAIASLSRSTGLTKGRRWTILGFLIVLTMVVTAGTAAVSLIVALPLELLGLNLVGQLAGQLIGAASMSLFVIAMAVIYHDLRVEKEGAGDDRAAAVFD